MALIKGDCIEKMKEIKSKSIDIVIADLPYGRFSHLAWDTPIDLGKMWEELNRICKKTTPICLFADMKFAIELINSNPKYFKYEIVWNKKQTTTPLLSKKRLGKATEYILLFYRKQCVYNYAKYHKIKKSPIELSHRVLGGGKIGGRVNYYEPCLPINVIDDINCHAVRRKKTIKHITEKPQPVLEFLLKYFSNEGDTCLDFTMGSGSCGVACKTLNRKFIGIEKMEDHFIKAKERLSKI